MLPLSIKNVKKSFCDKKVLKGISFDVRENEIFGLIGLNGIGKTTLIKTIIDILDKDSGDISIFGVDATNKISRENIAYLPEKFHPSTYLKGTEFLSMTYKSGKKNDLKLAKKLAKSLALEEKALCQKVSKYSKGMMQKLGLIYTLLSEAPLIILDEPMSGLDPKARIRLKEELINYKNSGHSVFLSSHILADMDEICDRIGVINNGKIVFIGTPKEFREKHSQQSLEKAFLEEIGE